MNRTAKAAEFLADPVGKALIGPTWVYFCPDPELFGFALWGRPGADDMDALVRALKVELGPGIAPHRSLVDASRLEGADAGAFEVLLRYVTDHRVPLSQAVTRLALVRPTGLAGATIAGFYEVLARPYPVMVFAEVSPA